MRLSLCFMGIAPIASTLPAVLAVIADDPDAACRQVAPLFSLFEPSMLEYLARGVLEPGALVAAAQAGGAPAVIGSLTPEVMRDLALVTTPQALGRALERYTATGIDELALSIAAAPEEQAEMVEQLARARAVVETGRRRSEQ